MIQLISSALIWRIGARNLLSIQRKASILFDYFGLASLHMSVVSYQGVTISDYLLLRHYHYFGISYGNFISVTGATSLLLRPSDDVLRYLVARRFLDITPLIASISLRHAEAAFGKWGFHVTAKVALSHESYNISALRFQSR